MRSLPREDLCSESFPNRDGKFIESRHSWDKGHAGRPGDSKVELFSRSVIWNTSDTIRQTRRAFYRCCCFWRLCAQKGFRQWLGYERARSNPRPKITFRMKPRESDVYSESRHSKVGRQIPGGGESARIVVESRGNQFIANLAVQLFMKRFIRGMIQADHFECHDGMATALLLTCLFICNSFHDSNCAH